MVSCMSCRIQGIFSGRVSGYGPRKVNSCFIWLATNSIWRRWPNCKSTCNKSTSACRYSSMYTCWWPRTTCSCWTWTSNASSHTPAFRKCLTTARTGRTPRARTATCSRFWTRTSSSNSCQTKIPIIVHSEAANCMFWGWGIRRYWLWCIHSSRQSGHSGWSPSGVWRIVEARSFRVASSWELRGQERVNIGSPSMGTRCLCISMKIGGMVLALKANFWKLKILK